MTKPTEIRIRPIADAELETAVGVLSRGMRDNPGHIAAFGDDPDARERSLAAMFRGLFRVATDRTMLGAYDGDTMVGFGASALPNRCRLSPGQQARAAGAMIGVGPPALLRVLRWQQAWGGQHPSQAHHHFGPVAVDRDRQGQGIGSAIMKEYAARWDESGLPAYLETDKPENVTFYTRHGFGVIAEDTVLGRPNWFMWR